MTQKTVRALLGIAWFFFSAFHAAAANPSPFFTQNQSPVTAVYGLPFIGEAKVAAGGKGQFRLTLDYANSYVRDANAREDIVLDGESLRLTVSGRLGIGRAAEVGIDVPFWMSGGGFLDGVIDRYHSAFGFPGGGRDLAPKNRLMYRYRKDGITLLNREAAGQGPGDLSLNGGWQLHKGPDRNSHLSVRGALKLPTGDTGALRGSGSTDLAVWLAGDLGHTFSAGQMTLFGAAGAMGMSKGRILPDQQRPLVGFGSLGLAFRPSSWIEFKIQTNAHTSFYSDSDLREINSPSAQLTVGAALHFSPGTSLDIGVTEDIVVDTSPDVVFHLSLGHSF